MGSGGLCCCICVVTVPQQPILVDHGDELKHDTQSKSRKQSHRQTQHVSMPGVCVARCNTARGFKQSQTSAATKGFPHRTCRARRTACATSSAVCCCPWSAGRPSITTAACLLMSCMMLSWTLPLCTPCPGSCNAAGPFDLAHSWQVSVNGECKSTVNRR